MVVERWKYLSHQRRKRVNQWSRPNANPMPTFLFCFPNNSFTFTFTFTFIIQLFRGGKIKDTKNVFPESTRLIVIDCRLLIWTVPCFLWLDCYPTTLRTNIMSSIHKWNFTQKTKKQKWSKFFVLPLCIYILGENCPWIWSYEIQLFWQNPIEYWIMSIMMTCVTIYTLKNIYFYLFSWLEEKETLAADFVKLH